jgi:hypothetical protein
LGDKNTSYAIVRFQKNSDLPDIEEDHPGQPEENKESVVEEESKEVQALGQPKKIDQLISLMN